jgi:hypothetical protein
MFSGSEKARESRCRRLAAKYGYVLRKSRRYIDFGCYVLIDARCNCVAYGTDNSGCCVASLDDIEAILTGSDN